MARPRKRDEMDLTPMEARVYRLMVETSLRYEDMVPVVHLSFRSTQQIATRVLSKRNASSRLELLVNHWRKKIDG